MTPPVTTGPKLLTADEFAAMPNPTDGSQQELVRGEVVTVPPPGFVHGVVQGNVAFLLKQYANRSKSGRVTVEWGVIPVSGPDTVRGPDVAFWSFDRLPAEQTPVVYANVAADVVAEVVSPSNTRKQVARKVREYFASGIRLVWVVDPDERTVTVYHKPGDGTVLWEDATLTGGDVLPGFACPVAELFA
jgi:Uma2 family endonuclease